MAYYGEAEYRAAAKEPLAGLGYSTYTPYEKYGDYQTLQEEMPDLKTLVQNIMTGKLSDVEMQNLQTQFGIGLQSTREGAYGMPIGAQKGLEGNVVAQAINNLQMNRMNYLQPLLGIMGGEKQYKYGAGVGEQRYGYEAGRGEWRYGQAQDKSTREYLGSLEKEKWAKETEQGDWLKDIITGMAGAATSFGLNRIPWNTPTIPGKIKMPGIV